jgi:TPR repeat protein
MMKPALRIPLMLAKAGTVVLLLQGAPLRAEEETDAHGTLNPEELTIEHHKRKLAQDDIVDINTCRLGYPLAKRGDTALARKVFERCANAGVDAAYPWMSWLEENGFQREGKSPHLAAEWDRRSAERGYSVGQLNYGLDLLRGHGITRDEARGKAMIDAAAAQGDKHARTVIENNYDPYSVLPYHERPKAF